MTTLTSYDYTIGWLCALPKEQAAVVFDTHHEKIEGINNPNFSLGRIGIHNVAMVCLPSMGPTEAARELDRLRNSFPNLRYVFIVGIAGGVPLVHGGDVRLGDIVVSVPGKTKAGREHAGVEQYDFGTQVQGQALRILKTAVGRPADELLQTLSKMHAAIAHREDGQELGDLIQHEVARLANKCPSMAGTTRPVSDQLFRAAAKHCDDSLDCEDARCAELGDQALEAREERVRPDIPLIHLGLIASGNKVMRDAVERDRIGKDTGALCFEMEAAGLHHELKWLVIRGICDYCDTHKNKKWQEYAAVVAASYARKLIMAMGPLNDEVPEGGAAESEEKFVNRSVVNGNVTVSGGSMFTGGQFSGGTFNFGK